MCVCVCGRCCCSFQRRLFVVFKMEFLSGVKERNQRERRRLPAVPANAALLRAATWDQEQHLRRQRVCGSFDRRRARAVFLLLRNLKGCRRRCGCGTLGKQPRGLERPAANTTEVGTRLAIIRTFTYTVRVCDLGEQSPPLNTAPSSDR